MNMRLLGAKTIADVVPEMVDASGIQAHTVAVPGDRLYDNNCKYLTTSALRQCFLTIEIDESMQHARLRELQSKL